MWKAFTLIVGAGACALWLGMWTETALSRSYVERLPSPAVRPEVPPIHAVTWSPAETPPPPPARKVV